MKVVKAFRNLDRHGQQRAPEVIEEELRQLRPHLARFHDDLVRLDVVASQTKGKTRVRASLRLQLPSGLLVAREDGFEIEPVLRKAFADLRHRVDRHVARLMRPVRGRLAWRQSDVRGVVCYLASLAALRLRRRRSRQLEIEASLEVVGG
jgi:hypothetical protein